MHNSLGKKHNTGPVCTPNNRDLGPSVLGESPINEFSINTPVATRGMENIVVTNE